jgi:hypothetical protein
VTAAIDDSDCAEADTSPPSMPEKASSRQDRDSASPLKEHWKVLRTKHSAHFDSPHWLSKYFYLLLAAKNIEKIRRPFEHIAIERRLLSRLFCRLRPIVRT